MIHRVHVLAAAAMALALPASGQDRLSEILSAPVTVVRSAPLTSVAIERHFGKLVVRASANGESRRFIFDTGSPSLLTRELARALDLDIVGTHTGVDANGREVTTEIAVVRSLTIGEVEFRDVPVLVFDPSALDGGTCVFDGGVLGSEIFPGSAWQIDLEAARLTIAGSADALAPDRSRRLLRLHDGGYPHAPIVDYGVGTVRDRALFDTGSGETVALFRRLVDDPGVREAIVPGSMEEGRGREGVSAGGWGEDTDLLRFILSDLDVGGQQLAPVPATTRSAPPTILGAGLLDRFVVTLDYPGRQVILEPRPVPDAPPANGPYAIAFVDGNPEVVRIFNGSQAAHAGLRLGDRVASVDGRSLSGLAPSERCEAMRWLSETFDPSRGATLVILRDGRTLEIEVPAADAGPAGRPDSFLPS